MGYIRGVIVIILIIIIPVIYTVTMAYLCFKHRKVELTAILAILYWPCGIWVFFLEPWLGGKIGVGMGKYSQFDIFIGEHFIIGMLYGLLAALVYLFAWVGPLGMVIHLIALSASDFKKPTL
jgi:hypothetical protein